MSLENFNSYTEVDEGNDVTVESATKVSWVDLYSRNETAYLYKDFGSGFFSKDSIHKFEMSFSNVEDHARAVHYMLANMIGDERAIRDAGGDAALVISYDDTETIYGGFIEDGVSNVDTWAAPGPQPSTNYFVTVIRDYTGGVSETGRLVIYICTGNYAGEAGSTLKDTLAADAGSGQQNDYQYTYVLATYDDALFTVTNDGYTQNMDLGFNIPALQYQYRRRRT